jgi:hypothetical protein
VPARIVALAAPELARTVPAPTAGPGEAGALGAGAVVDAEELVAAAGGAVAV